MNYADTSALLREFRLLFDFGRSNPYISGMTAKTNQWARRTRSTSSWHHLAASVADNGERWTIVWDTQRRPGSAGRSVAREKLERDALELARHLLRMGFIVYEIHEPSGAVHLAEDALRQRLGEPAAAT